MDNDSLLTLTFFAYAPAMGFETYTIYVSKSSQSNVTPVKTVSDISDVTISGTFVSATVSGETGRISSITHRGMQLAVDVNLLWYNASDGNSVSSQPSGETKEGNNKRKEAELLLGAYIFRPNSSTPLSVAPNNHPLQTQVVPGDLVHEIRQT